jgi:hypothetical protein
VAGGGTRASLGLGAPKGTFGKDRGGRWPPSHMQRWPRAVQRTGHAVEAAPMAENEEGRSTGASRHQGEPNSKDERVRDSSERAGHGEGAAAVTAAAAAELVRAFDFGREG